MTPGALFDRHRRIAYGQATNYYVPGYDKEDVRQEALIALWKAACTYNPTMGATFARFAHICIRAHFASLLKGAYREKRRVLDEALRTIGEDELDITEALADHRQVADVSEERDLVRRLLTAIAALPEFQQRCVMGFAAGLSYAEISEGGPKRVDNALMRARVKLRAAVM